MRSARICALYASVIRFEAVDQERRARDAFIDELVNRIPEVVFDVSAVRLSTFLVHSIALASPAERSAGVGLSAIRCAFVSLA